MKQKLREWLWRYLPAEIAGTITALASAFVAYQLFKNEVITAYAGAWGENIGYYSVIFLREFLKENGASFKNFVKIVRNVFVEFGVAELIDSFVLRPLFMFIFPQLLNNYPVGILVGKIAADITFYIPAILGYEVRKKYF